MKAVIHFTEDSPYYQHGEKFRIAENLTEVHRQEHVTGFESDIEGSGFAPMNRYIAEFEVVPDGYSFHSIRDYNERKGEDLTTLPIISKGGEFRALIDSQDYERLSAYKWYLNNRGYVLRYETIPLDERSGGSKSRNIYLHHEIVGKREGLQVDHINQDKLDNRRSNLRFATNSQNNSNKPSTTNTSGYRGVYKEGSKWAACISVMNKTRYLGVRETAEEAARLYDCSAIEEFGEFATLNFPPLEDLEKELERLTSEHDNEHCRRIHEANGKHFDDWVAGPACMCSCHESKRECACDEEGLCKLHGEIASRTAKVEEIIEDLREVQRQINLMHSGLAHKGIYDVIGKLKDL